MARPKSANSTPPQTELDCRRLQELYLQPDCPQKTKDEYFMLLRTYARSIALKEIKSKSIYLPPERVDEICTDATLLLLKQYKKEGWTVWGSFAGALRWKVIEAMFGPAKEETNYSLNTTFTEDQNSKEVMDLVGDDVDTPWDAFSGREPRSSNPVDNLLAQINSSYDEIKEVVDQAYEMLPYPTFMRFLPWLILQLRKPRTRNAQQLFERLFLTNKESNAFDILWLEIKRRISCHDV